MQLLLDLIDEQDMSVIVIAGQRRADRLKKTSQALAAEAAAEARDRLSRAPGSQAGAQQANTAQVTETIFANAGYWSEENAKDCEKRGVNAHSDTGKQLHRKSPPPLHSLTPKDLDAKGRMARKLRKKEGRWRDTKPKTIVEPVLVKPSKREGCNVYSCAGCGNGIGDPTPTREQESANYQRNSAKENKGKGRVALDGVSGYATKSVRYLHVAILRTFLIG